jgi:hypothetical protein
MPDLFTVPLVGFCVGCGAVYASRDDADACSCGCRKVSLLRLGDEERRGACLLCPVCSDRPALVWGGGHA